MSRTSFSYGLSLLLFAFLFCIPSLLLAQSATMDLGPKTTGIYYGLAAGEVEYSQDLFYDNSFGTFESREEIKVSTIELRVGKSYNRWISLEGRLGIGGEGSTRVNYTDTEATFDLPLYQNFFLKVKYPSYIQPYGMIGLSHTDTEFCLEGQDCDSSIDWRPAFGYGVFIPLRGDYTTGLYAEALHYNRSTDIEQEFNAELDQFIGGLMIGF